jgi:hypothetical protein
MLEALARKKAETAEFRVALMVGHRGSGGRGVWQVLGLLKSVRMAQGCVAFIQCV